MFLEDYHNQEKLLKQEQNRNYLQQQEERDEDLTELQIEENFTFLGIKNRQNRFIKVRPNEFADITKLDKWKKYFERIQKDELFDAKITFSSDECKSKMQESTNLYMITGKCLFSDPKCSITTDTKPPIAVATKGMNKDHALEEAIKLVVYHLQISCGQLS